MNRVQTIFRDNIDKNRLYTIKLKESPDLLLVAYIADFTVDGYIVLDKSHITNIKNTSTNIFMEMIMLSEKSLPKPEAIITGINIGSWRSVFKCILGEYISIENEKNGDYWWGKITGCDNAGAVIKHYDGTGKYKLDKLVKYKDITRISIGDRYTTIFKKYINIKPDNA